MFRGSTLEIGEEVAEVVSSQRALIREFRLAFKDAYKDRKHVLERYDPVSKPKDLAMETDKSFQEAWDSIAHGMGENDEMRSRYLGFSLGELMAGIEFGVCRSKTFDQGEILRNVGFIVNELRNYGFHEKLFGLLGKRIKRIRDKCELQENQARLVQSVLRVFGQ